MSLRALTVTFVVASLAWAGGAWLASRAPAPPVSVEPVAEVPAEPKNMSVQMLPAVTRPDGRKPLQPTRFGAAELPIPGLDALSGEPKKAALGVLNNVTGACDPCQEAGLSLAACYLRRPEGCAVVETLAARVVRMAAAGRDVQEIWRSSRYDDSWFPVSAGPGPAEGAADAPIQLLVAVDYASPFTARGEETLAALRARYGAALRVEYFFVPRQEPRPMKAAEDALAAQLAGCFAQAHAALVANPEDADAAERACGKPLEPFRAEAAERLRADMARGKALGVRGTPTVFLNGYRVRGARELSEYVWYCELELQDRGS